VAIFAPLIMGGGPNKAAEVGALAEPARRQEHRGGLGTIAQAGIVAVYCVMKTISRNVRMHAAKCTKVHCLQAGQAPVMT
jgi:hypothetical protein